MQSLTPDFPLYAESQVCDQTQPAGLIPESSREVMENLGAALRYVLGFLRFFEPLTYAK